jgi:hypothetical protein
MMAIFRAIVPRMEFPFEELETAPSLASRVSCSEQAEMVGLSF